jgi:tRNA threonylcarbamoyladenosine biosynthesis protein TsaE
MATCISSSPADTEALGETWGRSAASGLVIGLCGELGAGKTQLVKGLARGLGVTERVHSPTFALVNVYSGGRLALYHLDLYRLETAEQIERAGLDALLDLSGVIAIEWANKWFEGLSVPIGRQPQPGKPSFDAVGAGCPFPFRVLRWVVLETISEAERRISYEDFGS